MTAGVEVLDVTLRDGGYLNDHGWSTERVVGVLGALGAAGVRWAEVGYLAAADGAARTGAGGAAFGCDPGSLAAVAGRVPAAPALVVMVKATARTPDDVAALAGGPVGMVRFPISPLAVRSIADHCAAARSAGVRVAVNLTRASEWPAPVLVDASREAADVGADVVYLADSNGSMFPGAVQDLFETVGAGSPVTLGFHAHDNLRLAFANALSAAAGGARFLDSSVAGIGKGGGNLMTELMCAYLADREGATFDVGALEAARDLVRPERRQLDAQGLDAIVAGVRDLNLDDVERLTAGGDRLLSLLAPERRKEPVA